MQLAAKPMLFSAHIRLKYISVKINPHFTLITKIIKKVKTLLCGI